MIGTGPQLDGETAARHLSTLTAAYPAFRFSREPFGWKGSRWVAERHDHTAAGLRVVVTDDLAELRKALDQ
jgi:hypothetical protein